MIRDVVVYLSTRNTSNAFFRCSSSPSAPSVEKDIASGENLLLLPLLLVKIQ